MRENETNIDSMASPGQKIAKKGSLIGQIAVFVNYFEFNSAAVVKESERSVLVPLG